jgi:hypothetical protein
MIPSVRTQKSEHGSKETGFVLRPLGLDSLPLPLSNNEFKNRQMERIRVSLDLLDAFRYKLDQQLEYFGGLDSFKISRDAQLHPWANLLATEQFPLFAHPKLFGWRLPI